MKYYRDVLIKELIFVSIIIILALVICIVGLIIVKKLKLEKSLFVFISMVVVVAVMFGGIHIANLSLDLKFNSFETHTGKYSCPARGTLILEECGNNIKLHTAISIPNTVNNITIIYSKRSKIVVGFKQNT